MIAGGIAIGVGIHSIFHMACDFPRLILASSDRYKPMETFFGKQPLKYWNFVKSVEGVTGIIMVVLMAISFTLACPWLRRGKPNLPKFLKNLTGFNAFWYTHHLFIIVYALLILHGLQLYLIKEWYKKTVKHLSPHTFDLFYSHSFAFLVIITPYITFSCSTIIGRPGCIWLFLLLFIYVKDWSGHSDPVLSLFQY